MRIAKLESDGELKQVMKERDLEMRNFVKAKSEEISRLKIENNDQQKEIEELQN